MSKKFDFVLNDDKRFYRTVLRFYPKNTHVHGFNDDPPKLWSEVYKVYYSWSILWQNYDDDGVKIEPQSSMILFDMPCDECSQIPNLSEIIKHVIKTGEKFDYPSFGQPAGDWSIEKHTGVYCNNEPYENYHFVVFNSLCDNGFRFTLDRKRTEEFCDWLDKINAYALAHSEGI